jgi:two-component system sensor histidine kinase PilS (NtrC family)
MIQWAVKKWPRFFGGTTELRSSLSLHWLLLGRLVVCYFLLLALVITEVTHTNQNTQQIILAFTVLTILFGISLLSGLFLNVTSSQNWLGYTNLLIDALAISSWFFISFTSGSPVVLLYLVLITIASLTYFTKGALFAASVSSFLYGFVMFNNSGWSPHNLLTWGTYSLMFISVAFVGGYLSEELKRTTEGLQAKSREIENLTLLYEGIIEGMPTGLLTVDSHMKTAFVNPGAEVILGKNRNEVIGRFLKEVEPDLLPFFEQIESERIEDESDDTQQPGIETELTATGTEWHRSVFLKARLQKGQARLQQTVELGNGKNKRILRGDVAEIDVTSQVGRLFSQSEGVGRVLLFQDVTKLVHLEEKLKQNEKLAAVGQLAAGIAHEIRNPLASMSASIQMLQEGLAPGVLGKEDSRLMSIIGKEIDRLNELISDFLNFVKPEKFNSETVRVESLIMEVIDQAKNSKEFQSQIELKTRCEKELLALGNSEKLKQVLWNLLSNAIQSMKKPGFVEIGCETVSPHWVCFWVQDQGEGMTEEVIQHLYEPFFTTKARGTGLGLATVYKIIEAHQGEIRVQSKVGEGTRFEVHLQKG